MRIAVLVKLALDTSQLRIKDGIAIDETPLKINDVDRNAVEEAVKLKGHDKAYAISAIKWGPLDKRIREAENLLREILAMGLDEAYLIADEKLIGKTQSTTAKALASAIRRIGADLVLAAEASVDNYTGQIPARVAAELNWPVLSYARELKIEGSKLMVKRDLDDYVEAVEAEPPLVISVTREINTPRIPTLLSIRAAMKKPVYKFTLLDLGAETSPRAEVAAYKPLVVQRRRIIIKEGSAEDKAKKLLEFLRSEGVI